MRKTLLWISLFIFSLGLWSLRTGATLNNDRMLFKGALLAFYALVLGVVALRLRAALLRVVLLGVLGALLLGEGVTRLVNPPTEDPDYRHPAPYVMFAGHPNGVIEDKSITLSALGYRDAPPLPKPTDEYRVMMLGGSTVFNGAPRAVSIAGALEANLHAAGYGQVRVYNWGVFSVVSGQELAAILFRAVDYAPDMILVYSGSNDLTEPFIFDPRPGYPFDFMAIEGGQRLISGDYSLYDLYAVLLRPSSLGYTLFQFEIEEQITRRSQLATQAAAGREDWRAQIVAQYAANLEKMCRLSTAFDFQFVAVLQPMIFFKDRLVGDEPNWLGGADYQEHTRRAYDQTRAAYAQLARAYPHCVFYDASRLLQDESAALFVDPVHLNDAGRVKVAAGLAPRLASLLE